MLKKKPLDTFYQRSTNLSNFESAIFHVESDHLWTYNRDYEDFLTINGYNILTINQKILFDSKYSI